MKIFIPQTLRNLIIFLGLLGIFNSCNASTSSHLKEYQTKSVTLPSGEVVKAYVAITDPQQKKGLSGIKKEDFEDHWGMLFPAEKMFVRQFWMPNTHFDMDVIFMNEDYYILDIHRSLKHYPSTTKGSRVPLSKRVFSQHVLEIKSNSPLAKKIHPGMTLKVK